MHKEIHIIRGSEKEDYNHFTTRILELLSELQETCNPHSLRCSVTTRPPPRFSVIPFRREKVAVVSIKTDSTGGSEFLMQSPDYNGGYRVEEAVPVAYTKNWKDHTPTPGACLLTLFHRKPGIDHAGFLERWHNGHTPLSLRLHPLWNYNRNVVKEMLQPGIDWYDGIVEEQVSEISRLLNPMIFFGPPLKVPLHMLQVYRDTKSFIDMKRIETYLATEYHIKS